jgi:hypothetical protein
MITRRDSLIYEYGHEYFVIQRSQQGKSPKAEWGPQQRLSDNSGLTARVPRDVPDQEIGTAVITALRDFDRHPPKYDPHELKELRKQLSEWLGARGYPTIVKNSRMVLVVTDMAKHVTTVTPFDNHNRNPFESPMTDKEITLPENPSAAELGRAVNAAFRVSTFHPERKDPK